MVVLNALATRAGGAAVRVREVAARAPRLWRTPLLVVHNRGIGFDDVELEGVRAEGWPWALERAPAVPRRIVEAPALRRRLRGETPRAILHYGTYVPLRTGKATLNVLCFVSLAPWDPGAASQHARNRLLRWLFERTWQRADLIVVQSDATRVFLEEQYPALNGRLAVVRNGLSLPPVVRPAETAGFLILGDVYGYRRIADVIRAYARLQPELRAQHPLVIAGHTGRDPEALTAVRRALAETGVDTVRMLGLVPRARALQLIAETRVFVSFASVENGPNAVAEAAAIGTSLVLSDILAHREYGGPGARFAGDVTALAAALHDAATAPAPRPASLPAGLDTWDDHVERLGAVLRDAGALEAVPPLGASA